MPIRSYGQPPMKISPAPCKFPPCISLFKVSGASPTHGSMAELAYAAVSKTAAGNGLRVRSTLLLPYENSNLPIRVLFHLQRRYSLSFTDASDLYGSYPGSGGNSPMLCGVSLLLGRVMARWKVQVHLTITYVRPIFRKRYAPNAMTALSSIIL